MLNGLWAGMIIVGVGWAALQGNMAAVTEGALTGAKEAVSLSITMLGVMSFWTGVMEIAARSRLLEVLTGAARPLIRFLFPDVPAGHPAGEKIATNMIANFLGLGWAATPAGLQAMEELAKLQEEENGAAGAAPGNGPQAPRQRPPAYGAASNAMCTFLVINMSSIQLLPMTMIAYRSQFASANPASIVAPALLATTASAVAAIVFCKIMCVTGRRYGR